MKTRQFISSVAAAITVFFGFVPTAHGEMVDGCSSTGQYPQLEALMKQAGLQGTRTNKFN